MKVRRPYTKHFWGLSQGQSGRNVACLATSVEYPVVLCIRFLDQQEVQFLNPTLVLALEDYLSPAWDYGVMDRVLGLEWRHPDLIPAQLPSPLGGIGQVSEHIQMMTKSASLIHHYLFYLKYFILCSQPRF